ncbi:MAG: IclR family transcriptional regulator [Rhodococcus sp. (in: high G+C Gram-positive bacteria)]
MSTLQTLDRGLRALELIAMSADGMSVADLARELDVHRAICYRIVTTLEERSFVARLQDGRIRLGAATAVLAAHFAPQLYGGAAPILQTLAETTGSSAFLSTAQGSECVVMAVADPPTSIIRVGYRVGNRHPLTQGATGIAILALRPPQPDEPDSVRQARIDGYVITRGQIERGTVGVAAGVQLAAGPHVASSVQFSVGVVAIDGLDTGTAAIAVVSAARKMGDLLSA